MATKTNCQMVLIGVIGGELYRVSFPEAIPLSEAAPLSLYHKPGEVLVSLRPPTGKVDDNLSHLGIDSFFC